MLDRFTWIVDGLVVYPERMRRNLDASHNLFFSHRLLLALVESGLERADAYAIVQRAAMRAWDEERDFVQLARDDATVNGRLGADRLDEVFDLDATVAHLDSVFDRVHRLAQKEPAHV
jgi:adenylosuccinate lyase